MRILGVLNEKLDHNKGFEASTWYRCIIPLQMVERAGLAETAFVDCRILLEAWKKGNIAKIVANFDVVQFQRVVLSDTVLGNEDHTKLAKDIRALGCAVVVDYDDDYTSQFRDIGSKMPNMKAWNGVTVSTPYLMDLLRPYAKHIRVIPNLVVPSMFNNLPRKLAPDKIVVGLTGSGSHADDWDVVAPVLEQIAKENPSVALFCGGYLPSSIASIPGIMTLADLVPGAPKECHMIFHQYGIVPRQIDILLCPVNPKDRYNFARSPLKALEGWTSRRVVELNGLKRLGGCAVVATGGNLPVYKNVVKHNENGFLVEHEDTDAWYDAITSLVKDPGLRSRLQIAGHRTAGEFAVGKPQAKAFVETYKGLARKD